MGSRSQPSAVAGDFNSSPPEQVFVLWWQTRPQPPPLELLPQYTVREFACSADLAAFATTSGNVFLWRVLSAQDYAAGRPPGAPVAVNLRAVTRVACGGRIGNCFAAFITAQGGAGVVVPQQSLEPVIIDCVPAPLVDVACGADGAFFLDGTGGVWWAGSLAAKATAPPGVSRLPIVGARSVAAAGAYAVISVSPSYGPGGDSGIGSQAVLVLRQGSGGSRWQRVRQFNFRRPIDFVGVTNEGGVLIVERGGGAVDAGAAAAAARAAAGGREQKGSNPFPRFFGFLFDCGTGAVNADFALPQVAAWDRRFVQVVSGTSDAGKAPGPAAVSLIVRDGEGGVFRVPLGPQRLSEQALTPPRAEFEYNFSALAVVAEPPLLLALGVRKRRDGSCAALRRSSGRELLTAGDCPHCGELRRELAEVAAMYKRDLGDVLQRVDSEAAARRADLPAGSASGSALAVGAAGGADGGSAADGTAPGDGEAGAVRRAAAADAGVQTAPLPLPASDDVTSLERRCATLSTDLSLVERSMAEFELRIEQLEKRLVFVSGDKARLKRDLAQLEDLMRESAAEAVAREKGLRKTLDGLRERHDALLRERAQLKKDLFAARGAGEPATKPPRASGECAVQTEDAKLSDFPAFYDRVTDLERQRADLARDNADVMERVAKIELRKSDWVPPERLREAEARAAGWELRYAGLAAALRRGGFWQAAGVAEPPQPPPPAAPLAAVAVPKLARSQEPSNCRRRLSGVSRENRGKTRNVLEDSSSTSEDSRSGENDENEVWDGSSSPDKGAEREVDFSAQSGDGKSADKPADAGSAHSFERAVETSAKALAVAIARAVAPPAETPRGQFNSGSEETAFLRAKVKALEAIVANGQAV